MSKECRTIEEVTDPIMLVRGVQGITYDETGKIELVDGGRRRCKVLGIDGGSTMVQLYRAPADIDLDPSKVYFLGRTMELGMSEDMPSRMFDGMDKPTNGGPDIPPERCMDINGLPMNPAARSYPEEFTRTGISAVNGLDTLVRGQKLPIFSASGLPHAGLAAQIARQAEVRGTDESFAVIFAATGITSEEANSFMESFRGAGTIGRSVIFINLANGPAIERIVTPCMALTIAEYLAFEKNMHVLVVLTNITSYADSLRKTLVARKEVSGRHGYPGYVHTDLASLYEGAGRQEDKDGFTTMIPALTMPGDDKTHPIPDPIGYVTEGQIVLSRKLYRKNVASPINVLPSLPHLKDKGIGEDKTRADHTDVMNQLFVAYARDRGTKELMIILGEVTPTDMDRLYVKFIGEFEKECASQDCYADRDIKKIMEVGQRLLRILPRSELKRIKDKFLDLYCEAR